MEINDDVNLKVPLTKLQLNQLCSDLFIRAIQQVDLALNTAQMKTEDINYVVNSSFNNCISNKINCFRFSLVGQPEYRELENF